MAGNGICCHVGRHQHVETLNVYRLFAFSTSAMERILNVTKNYALGMIDTAKTN